MHRMWAFSEVFYKAYTYISLFKMTIHGYVSHLFSIWINRVMVRMILCDTPADIWLPTHPNNRVDLFVRYGSRESPISKWIVENSPMTCFTAWASSMLQLLLLNSAFIDWLDTNQVKISTCRSDCWMNGWITKKLGAKMGQRMDKWIRYDTMLSLQNYKPTSMILQSVLLGKLHS